MKGNSHGQEMGMDYDINFLFRCALSQSNSPKSRMNGMTFGSLILRTSSPRSRDVLPDTTCSCFFLLSIAFCELLNRRAIVKGSIPRN